MFNAHIASVTIFTMFTAVSVLTAPATIYAQERRAQTGIFGAGQPGEVSVVRMEAKKLGLKDFQMQSRQVDGRLAIDAFSGQLGSGMLQGRGLVDWSRPEPPYPAVLGEGDVAALAASDRLYARKFDIDADRAVFGAIDRRIRAVETA